MLLLNIYMLIQKSHTYNIYRLLIFISMLLLLHGALKPLLLVLLAMSKGGHSFAQEGSVDSTIPHVHP